MTRHTNALSEECDSGEVQRTHLPTEWQCALLIILLVQTRQKELESRAIARKISRARISQNTIRKLCLRSQLSGDFLTVVQEHLLAAGWALFCIGPTHYAVIKVGSTKGWGRISGNRIKEKLAQVARGEFPWKEYERLLLATGDGTDEQDYSEADREEREAED